MVPDISAVYSFTGVAWIFHNGDLTQGQQPQVITRWPSTLAHNSDRQKVPSKIDYDSDTGNKVA